MKNAVIQSIIHKAQCYLADDHPAKTHNIAYECENVFLQLAIAAESGDKQAVQDAIKRIMKSRSVKIAALIHQQEVKAEAGTLPDIMAKLPRMNFKVDCGEPFYTKAKPKNGFSPAVGAAPTKLPPQQSYRQVCGFGHIRRARGWVVCRMLDILHPPHPSDFLVKGRGTEALCDHIKKQGWGKKKHTTHFVIFDIKNYFPSVQLKQEVVELLGLPECLVRFDIFTSPNTPVVLSGVLPLGVSEDLFVGAARQGLPQGKATSSRVASILFGRILEQIVPAHRFSYYGDDGGIVCGATDGGKIAEALSGAMKSHPAGPFQLKHCKVVNFKDGFEMVKYWYRNTSYKDRIRIAPSATSFRRLESRVAEIVAHEPTEKGSLQAYAYVGHWCRAFPRWKISKKGFRRVLKNVDAGVALGMQQAKADQKPKMKKKIKIIKKVGVGC